MEKFIPYEKLSKKKRRELDAARRGSWGGVNPITKKPQNSKAYNRRKTQDWKRELPPKPVSFVICVFICAARLTENVSSAARYELLGEMRHIPVERFPDAFQCRPVGGVPAHHAFQQHFLRNIRLRRDILRHLYSRRFNTAVHGKPVYCNRHVRRLVHHWRPVQKGIKTCHVSVQRAVYCRKLSGQTEAPAQAFCNQTISSHLFGFRKSRRRAISVR